VVLQNYRDFLKIAPDEGSETCYLSRAIDIKDEDTRGVQEEEYPMPITFPVIKAEHEVCLCKHYSVIVTVTLWCYKMSQALPPSSDPLCIPSVFLYH
jgi:hypothetical protein